MKKEISLGEKTKRNGHNEEKEISQKKLSRTNKP